MSTRCRSMQRRRNLSINDVINVSVNNNNKDNKDNQNIPNNEYKFETIDRGSLRCNGDCGSNLSKIIEKCLNKQVIIISIMC